MRSVSGLEEARAALREGCRLLVSPPYAACHAGVGYYAALFARLREEFPQPEWIFYLCCGDDAAHAHAALRLGIRHIRLHAATPGLGALQAAAQEVGAAIALMRDG